MIYFWENFTLSNSIILVEDLIKWKKGFEIFLIDHYAGILETKITLVSIKKFLGSFNICTFYLHVKEAC